ncbi:MAG: LysR substrate-binding domain-containing protein [Acetobacteraceae bacterium]|nr:LysR substrate-binding domain-containing protein [Acetobacteraceae bacterium]
MELRHLRYFLAVAQTRSFTQAAQLLNVAQPALSVQIRALEDEIGVKLLTRTKRRVELTEAGIHFLQRTVEILDAASKASAEARDVASGYRGTVNLAFIASVGQTLLPAMMRRIRQTAQGLHLKLSEMPSASQITVLSRGDIDIGLLRGPVSERGVKTKVLRSDPLMAILPESLPLARQGEVNLRALAEKEFIMFSRQGAPGLHDLVMTACLRMGVTPNITHQASNYRTILDLVAGDLGVSIQPATQSGRIAQGVIARPIGDLSVASDLLLAIRDQPISSALQLVIDAIEWAIGNEKP